MKTRIILVRHAEAEGNLKRLFHGWTDGELTEKGHVQARLAAERLKNHPVDVLYSSSLKRTLQTAEYISRAKNLPIIRTDQLKEINGGDWEGVPFDSLNEKWPEEYDTWENKPHLHRMPGGESMEEFQERLVKEVESIIDENKGKNILIVTHGTAIKALICHFRACDLSEMYNINWCDNTAVTVLDNEDGFYNLVLEGDSSHLDENQSTIKNQDWWKENARILENDREGKADK